MFSLPIRVVIVLAAAGYGANRLANGDQTGYALLVASVIFMLGFFRYGAIRPAYMAMRRGDLAFAQKHVDTIRYPSLLSAESRAYLHWVRGSLAAQDPENLTYAEEQLEAAIAGAIRTSNDRCLAMATLAEIVAKNSNLQRARQLLAEAELIPHRANASEYLSKLKAEFDNR